MARSVKLQATFEVVDSAGVKEILNVVNESDVITESTCLLQEIDATTVDLSMNFGGIVTAKRALISTDVDITLKVNAIGDTGFTIRGTTILTGDITALFITTGGQKATVTVILVE